MPYPSEMKLRSKSKWLALGAVALAYALFAALLTPVGAQAQQDIMPPTLVDVQFAPKQIDTGAGPVTITVTVRITDNLSGLSYAALSFHRRGTTQSILVDFRDRGDGGRIKGDALNGYYRNTMTLPRYSAYGKWEFVAVTIADNVGNQTTYYKPEPGESDPLWPERFNNFAFAVGPLGAEQVSLFLPLSAKQP